MLDYEGRVYVKFLLGLLFRPISSTKNLYIFSVPSTRCPIDKLQLFLNTCIQRLGDWIFNDTWKFYVIVFVEFEI